MKSVKIINYSIIFSILFHFYLFFPKISIAENWQSLLENNFDIVSTFDELQDWTGSIGKGDVALGAWWNPSLPKLLNGDQSKWTYYSNWSVGVPIGPWIGNQEPGNVWSGTKSLRLDYEANMGPSRLGMYFGDANLPVAERPSSGYEDIYIFYMIKYPPQFFARLKTDVNKFTYFDYLKTFVLSAGFRAVFDWGTPEQQAKALNVQEQQCYGLNYFIFTVTAELATDYELKVVDVLRVSDSSGISVLTKRGGGIAQGTNLSSCVRNEEWFGIEYYVKRGTSGTDQNGIVEFSNGRVEIWIYNSSGQIIGHSQFENQVHIRLFEDHRYNRIVLGGNRSWRKGDIAYNSNGSLHATPDSHVYIDDVVIHDKRIGPKYFFLKLGGILINNGAEKTFLKKVTLTLNAPEDATKMKFSNDNITWSTEESYANTKEWTLSNDEEKLKTVYVKYYVNGSWSESFTDSIDYDPDQTPPSISINLSPDKSGPYLKAENLTVTATFTDDNLIQGSPQIAIYYLDGVSNILNANMNEVNNKIWDYSFNIPLGSKGIDRITIIGTDEADNVGSLEYRPPSAPLNLRFEAQ